MLSKNVVCFFCASVLAAICTTLMLLGSTGDTRIADAAMQQNKETVRSLIKQAVDVNSSQGDGMTALHWAALNGDAEIAQMLIHAGANVKAVTRLGGYTPLFMAAKRGNAPVIDVLLKAGADAKLPALGGITPLMMAASSGNPDAVKLLVEAGAEVNATESERGQTALAFAAAFNNPDAIKELVHYGANVNQKSKWIKPVPPPVGDGLTRRQRKQQAQQKQQTGQQQEQAANDPTRAGGNPRGELTPLMYAARQGNFEAVGALVDSHANLNEVSADHSTALLLAIINGKFDVAKFLVERGADVTIASMDGATPLFAVVNIQWAPKTEMPQPTTKFEKTHYLDLMKVILDRGADPNARLKKDLWYTQNYEATNAAGATPFWKCAAVGDVDGMRMLVANGVDPNISNIDGVTPLLIAAGAGFHGNNELTTPGGRLATVKYLVEELHADVNVADTAAGDGGDDTMNTLKPKAFNLAAGGFTALHAAAARGDNAMILYLVSKGARVDTIAKNGITVADMANGPRQRIQPYPDTIALLEMLGSKNSHRCVSC